MTISIIGCGWFGFPFAQKLVRDGYTINGSTTSNDKISLLRDAGIIPFLIDLTLPDQLEVHRQFIDCDILIVTIPPKLRSSSAESYISMIEQIIASVKSHAVRNVIFISSTSVFRDVNETVSEISTPNPESASGQVLLVAERLFQVENDFKTTIVRFSGLVGPGRDPGRFFAGKNNVPNGRAPVNLVHLDDCCGICKLIIQRELFGHVIHACSPDHPQRQEFYTLASRGSAMSEPGFLDELREWKIVDATYSTKLLSYKYSIDNWLMWLARSSDNRTITK